MKGWKVLLIVLPSVISVDLQSMENYCLNGINHKSKPGPEASIFSYCKPWKNRSCCTKETADSAHNLNLYNFSFSQCNHIRPMSKQCRINFIKDLCFHECSPNVGPWIVKVNMKIRKERFYKVPICAKECDEWYDSCKDDYTCAKDWIRDFSWIDGKNVCKNQTCVTFQSMFNNSKTFCEKIWDGSWEYTSDEKPCMKLWFDETDENPNDAVTRAKIGEISRTAGRFTVQETNESNIPRFWCILFFPVLVHVTFGISY